MPRRVREVRKAQGTPVTDSFQKVWDSYEISRTRFVTHLVPCPYTDHFLFHSMGPHAVGAAIASLVLCLG